MTSREYAQAAFDYAINELEKAGINPKHIQLERQRGGYLGVEYSYEVGFQCDNFSEWVVADFVGDNEDKLKENLQWFMDEINSYTKSK